MKINVFRIDDRLIHGQIVTAWIAYANAKKIVVADDKAAKDEFQKSLLRMATPKTIELDILTLDEAKEALNNGDDTPILLLVRGPVEALQIIDSCEGVTSINVGNLNMKKGKTKVLDNMYLFPEDAKAFYDLADKGIETEVRVVPNDRSQAVLPLIEKAGFTK